MDDHYNQVMDRIAQSPKGETRFYFGYSSVLDQEAFQTWQKEHGYEDFRLPDGEIGFINDWTLDFNFPSRWWGGRAAGLVEAPTKKVYGLLFEIASEDWPIIQHKEGHVTGASVEVPVKVVRMNGEEGNTINATAFTTDPARCSHDGPISDRYRTAFERGARSRGLPEEYIKAVMSVRN